MGPHIVHVCCFVTVFLFLWYIHIPSNRSAYTATVAIYIHSNWWLTSPKSVRKFCRLESTRLPNIAVFMKYGGFHKCGIPKMLGFKWFKRESPIQMDDDWGYPPFLGNLHIHLHLDLLKSQWLDAKTSYFTTIRSIRVVKSWFVRVFSYSPDSWLRFFCYFGQFT